MKQLTFVIELDRCIGCKACQVACKLENKVALGPGRNKVCTVGPTGIYPDIQMYFLPVMCQQCENPPCVLYCPTSACYKDDADGVIRIDWEICINCGTCRQKCPYGCIIENKEMLVSDKCTLCADSRNRGEIPACVSSCCSSALHFGDINDPNDEVTSLLDSTPKEFIYSLPDDGNHPTACYILKHEKWIDFPVADAVEHSVFFNK